MYIIEKLVAKISSKKLPKLCLNNQVNEDTNSVSPYSKIMCNVLRKISKYQFYSISFDPARILLSM